MAGDWTPIEQATPRKPEVLKIAHLTGLSRRHVLGALVEFWQWAGEQSVDGRVDGDVSTLSELFGEDQKFWDAVVTAGWLVVENGTLFFPRADHWITRGAKSRLQKTSRQRRWRQSSTQVSTSASTEASIEASTKRLRPRLPTEEKRTEETTTPTPPSNCEPKPNQTDSTGWEVVVVSLEGEGVGRVKDAITSLQTFGVSIEDAQAVIAYWQAHKPDWDVGVLFNHLVQFRPGHDPTKGWPHSAKADQTANDQRLQREAEAAAEKAAKFRELEAERETADRRYAELESRFGDQLDVLDEPGVVAMIREAAPTNPKFLIGLYRRQGLSRLVRLPLITHLAAKAEKNSPSAPPGDDDD